MLLFVMVIWLFVSTSNNHATAEKLSKRIFVNWKENLRLTLTLDLNTNIQLVQLKFVTLLSHTYPYYIPN